MNRLNIYFTQKQTIQAKPLAPRETLNCKIVKVFYKSWCDAQAVQRLFGRRKAVAIHVITLAKTKKICM